MKHLLTVFSFLILLAPVFVLAQYQPLVGIPGVDDPQNFDEYLQSIYATAISLAALLAVIKIVIAGVKWMTTDIVTSKSDAKKDIEGAVFGLLIILGAVLILYIINPNIGSVNLSFTPPPTPTAPEGSVLDDDVRACQASETCTFDVLSCKVSSGTSGTNRGRAAETIYDCAIAQAQCLGDFAVSPEGKVLACLTYDTAAQARLDEIAAAQCPPGETCSAEACRSDECAIECAESEGMEYDPTTNVCIVSDTATLAQLDVEIAKMLDGSILRPTLVSNSTIKNEFASLVGGSQTYHLAELPGFSIGSTENNTIIATMRDLCRRVAQREDKPSLDTIEDTIDGVSYTGCVQP